MAPDHGSTGDVTEHYPLSPVQHGMLFHYVQSGPHTGVDIEQLEAKLYEPIDATAWVGAWRAVTDRHPVLRTRFRWEGVDSPRQEVVASVVAPVELHDLSALSPDEQSGRLVSFLADDRRRGFDLSVAPLWRVTLFRFGDAEQRMVWTYSHAILDSSFAEVLREVFAIYEAELRGEAPELEQRPAYREHILWLQSQLGTRADAARAFWRERLAGFVTPTNLDAAQIPATSAARSELAGHSTVHSRVARESSDAIRRLCAEHNLRVSTFVEAAWSLVLGAFSGEDDVVFGSTRAGRRSSIPGADSIVGLFINTVPVRALVEPDKPLLTLLGELRAGQLALREFEHTPLVDVIALADIARGTHLFETIVVFNDMSNDTRLKSFGQTWQARDFELHDQTNFPLNVMAYNEPQISFKLSYERSRFERNTVERVASLLCALLEAMAARPTATLGELPRLPEADTRALSGFNATRATISGPACIHEAFEAQVDRTPDAVATVFRGQALTYRELDEQANRVAEELAGLGVSADGMVGLFVERSLEMVVAMLAILKAGGAYVPMDPSYPRERIAIMLEDTQAPVVLTLDRLRSALPPTSATVLSLDAFGSTGSPHRLGMRAGGDNLAYCIFTSGSTGRPKGVQIEHRNVANFFGGMDTEVGTTPGVWLALTSISFDISVLEILWTLTRGFTVIVQEEAEGAKRAASRSRARTRLVGFSLFYFAADAGEETGGKYRLLLEGAKFADTHGFEAIWTPERHFHPFGGLYPNPALTSAAVAVITTRIAIRAGSVVLPLHNPIRCAEEWSVVDNLSNGRVGLSFASGWHASDFALAPDNFKDRRELMARGIERVRALWRGEAVPATSGDGKPIEVKMYPPPVQREPQIWVTASGSPETFAMAGRSGASILTNLLVMKPEELVANVAVYRNAYRQAGHSGDGHVTLMLHTFVGQNQEEVRRKVRQPFLEYLRTSTDLINKARWELTAFAKADDRVAPGGVTMNLDELSKEDMDAILDHAFERYFATAGLFGTPESCLATVDRLGDLGVDELACLIDFGVDSDSVLASLPHLDELRRLSAAQVVADDDGDDDNYAIAAQIRRYGVTHMQCTPSLLGLLAMDQEALAALGSLRTLLVGGEALPPTLVDRIQPRLNGVLRNMYGPTETTIWSTTSVVESGTPITIGHPIANTSVHIVDRRLRPLPMGVPGELLIGGAGVVRGYLARPELTAERFVDDPFGGDGQRLYRTGDLARWLASGELEFLGRLDHQIKIRGYRIELGEIETVLGEHPLVRESVVVARDGGTGDTRLVAYVVPGTAASNGGSRPSDWQAIWDQTYREARNGAPELNAAGWTSSFTGQAIPEAEMREWVDRTVTRVLASARAASARPRVLEIGCGTGMLLLRVAPHCAHYTGNDFSAAALAHVQSRLDAQGLHNVSLQRLEADELAALTDAGPFDAIVINSVIQYFPDVEYLVRVLKAAYARLAPAGVLFIGDVRGMAHLDAFHTAIELARAEDTTSVTDIQTRVRRRAAEEGELAIDPLFFDALAQELGDAVVERTELKAGRAHNEMTKFRFDAVLRKLGGAFAAPLGTPPAVQAPEPCTLEALRSLLADAPPALRVVGVPNARLAAEVRAAELLATGRAGGSVANLRAAARSGGPGLDPEDIRELDAAYAAVIEFAPGRPERMDVTFCHRAQAAPARWASHAPAAFGPLAGYANRPALQTAQAATLIPTLREHARLKLPEYMVPGAFVVLDGLPLTPNGKIDRAALPAPDRIRSESTKQEPPKNDFERQIVGVLKELVGVENVGVDDNFFDLGANSLLMVQASVHLRERLGRSVPLVRMFQFPTARSLAASLGAAEEDADNGAVKQSQDRAQVRRDAMQRMRELRGIRSRPGSDPAA
ncbi:MAG: LLM class flavin-dependent oxidoreductase [Chloroflexota bacterium]|nr:LLM class flavin-dependent oxidoreductase [Chloroflexota bacterium]